eukprot:scaffold28783_cov31-Phaeocystis_antarctica.AAC.1
MHMHGHGLRSSHAGQGVRGRLGTRSVRELFTMVCVVRGGVGVGCQGAPQWPPCSPPQQASCCPPP